MKKRAKRRTPEQKRRLERIVAWLKSVEQADPKAIKQFKELFTEACEATPAWACEHANEVPCACPCASNCYCRSNTCKGK